jgi:hypothetical protein
LSVVANLGYTLDYAQRMNLAAIVPRSDLCSSQYCLANPAAEGAEYLVYLPAGSIAETILGKVGLQNQNLDTVLAPRGSVTVDLSAARGELAVEWLNPQTGEVSLGSPITAGASRSFTAPFGGDAVLYLYQKVDQPAVSLSTYSAGSGTVAVHPPGPYALGQSVTLTATPAASWEFTGWSGDLLTPSNPISFPITHTMAVTATFAAADAPRPYTITTAALGQGTVQVTPSGPYHSGQVVALLGAPAQGWYFKQWQGDVRGSSNPTKFMIAANMVITALFEKLAFVYLPALSRGR